MNSSEKLHKIYEEYDLRIEVGMNAEEKILITICAYKDEFSLYGKNQFYGNGYWTDAAIDDLYEKIYNKKTAEQAA